MAVYGDCLTFDASLQWPVFDTSSLALLFSPEGVQVSELIFMMCLAFQHANRQLFAFKLANFIQKSLIFFSSPFLMQILEWNDPGRCWKKLMLHRHFVFGSCFFLITPKQLKPYRHSRTFFGQIELLLMWPSTRTFCIKIKHFSRASCTLQAMISQHAPKSSLHHIKLIEMGTGHLLSFVGVVSLKIGAATVGWRCSDWFTLKTL